jgi:hypothetical protein
MPFVAPAEMTSAEPLPGWKGRFFQSENMTFAIYDVDADAVSVHEHHHPEEEVWNIVAGKIVVSIDGTERILGPVLLTVTLMIETADGARRCRCARCGGG